MQANRSGSNGDTLCHEPASVVSSDTPVRQYRTEKASNISPRAPADNMRTLL